jgi:Putative DNA-binding domain
MLPVAVSVPDDANLIQLLNGLAISGSRLEPADVEFKADFDGSKPAWLDILKHIVAMANYGGGRLVFGVDRDGNRAGLRSSLLQTFDPANVSNKLKSHTTARVASSYRELDREGKRFGFLQVSRCDRVIVFESDGNYQGLDGKPGRAFIQGIVYTRVPGSTRDAAQVDLDAIIDRLVQQRLSKILARIERIAHAPLDSDLVVTRSGDTSRGILVGTSAPVRILPDIETHTTSVAPVNVRLAHSNPDAVLVSEIADAGVPFSSVDAELQTQVRLLRQSDASQRLSRHALSRFYLNRRELNLTPEAAEMCFISAAYGRGYPLFWASKMDLARLREVVYRELEQGKSPMIEMLPYVVCSFMWNDRDILSRPSSRTRKMLKARNIVANLLKFDSQSEFIRRARSAGATFEIDGESYVVDHLLNDHTTATAVFEKLVELDCHGRIDEKLRICDPT